MQGFTILLLAGGQSKRMGKDKRFIKLLNKSIIQTAIESAQKITSNIILSIHDPEEITKFKSITPSIPIIVDKNHHDRSPLIGIYSATQHIETKSTIVLPSDSPIISAKFVNTISAFLPYFDAVIPTWPDGKVEAIHAAYSTKKLYQASRRLLKNQQNQVTLLPCMIRNTLFLGIEHIKQADPNLISLTDIDTPNDLENYIKNFKVYFNDPVFT